MRKAGGTSAETVDELRAELSRLAGMLPESIDLLALHKRYKAPGKVQMLSESLVWRQEELCRNALAALDRENFVTAALLTRAAMETTAALVYLHSLVTRSIEKGCSPELEEKLTGFLTGSKIWEDIGGAIHVNDMLREVAKVIPGYFDEHYAMLSEIAHPNWSGTMGAYGMIDKEAMVVRFGRGGRSPENQQGTIIGRLAGSVGLFIGYYEMLGAMLPQFAKAVDDFYGGR